MTYTVKAELTFDKKRDAQRCVTELSNILFDRCSDTHIHIERETPHGTLTDDGVV
jgi:hypothetical protein